MRFLHTAVLALGATQASALSSKDIVTAIDGITDLSKKATDVAKDIKPTNLLQSIPNLIGDFKDIVVLALKTIENVGTSVATSKFGDSDQTDICDAFHDFVEIHQNLLQTVIGQGGLLSKTPITAPLGAVLSVLEGGVDTLADSVIGLVPTCADRAKKDLKALDETLDKTIDQLASSVPGAKQAIQAANSVVKGITGGIGAGASSLIGIFTGQGGGPLSGLFGGGGGQSGGSGGLLGGLLGGGNNSPGSGGGGLLGGLLGGGGSPMPGSNSDSMNGNSGQPMPGSNQGNQGNQGSYSYTFGPGGASMSSGSTGSISGSFPNGPNGEKPTVSMDNMGGYSVCYHVASGMPNSMMTMKKRGAMQTPAPNAAMAY